MSDTTERARQVEMIRAALKRLRGWLPEPQNKSASGKRDDAIVAARREYTDALKALDSLAAELAAAEKRIEAEVNRAQHFAEQAAAAEKERDEARRAGKLWCAEVARLPSKQAAEAFGRVNAALASASEGKP